MDRFEKDDGEIQHRDQSLDDGDEVSDAEPSLSPEEKSAEENSAVEFSRRREWSWECSGGLRWSRRRRSLLDRGGRGG